MKKSLYPTAWEDKLVFIVRHNDKDFGYPSDNKQKMVGTIMRTLRLEEDKQVLMDNGMSFHIDNVELLKDSCHLEGEAVWNPCKHKGFYFRHWFSTFFVCVECGTVFTKKQIEFYKDFNKPQI